MKWVMRGAMLVWLATIFLNDMLPSPDSLSPELFQPPEQEPLKPETININYRGELSTVIPRANYVIAGVVTSHNDPGKWYTFNITADSKSLNTRDLCIVTGKTLAEGHYEDADYWNGDFTCNVEYDRDLRLNFNDVTNNHLIADNDEIRRKIDDIRVGDEVYIKGKLADYQEQRWGQQWRKTSLTRTDRGKGAYEIIYVEEIKVINSYNTLWNALNEISLWLILGLASIRFVLFVKEPLR